MKIKAVAAIKSTLLLVDFKQIVRPFLFGGLIGNRRAGLALAVEKKRLIDAVYFAVIFNQRNK